jgi:site-specific DNA-cytosine methylase
VKQRKIKWISIIPLVGGMPIANKNVTDITPQYLISYAPFANNEVSLHNYWPAVKHSLIDEDLEGTRKLIKKSGKIDFVSSVCPCAGLSSLNSGGKANPDAKRGSDAIQNEWLYKAANFVLSEIKPHVYWGENAPALYTKTGRGVQDKLFAIAKKYNYSFSIVKTNTMLHGIPQHRQRTFYFFWDSKYAPTINWISKPAPTLKEYLDQIPKNALYQNKHFYKGGIKALTQIPIYKYMIHKLGKDYRKYLQEKNIGTIWHWIQEENLFDDAIKWIEEQKLDTTGKIVRRLKFIVEKLKNGKGYWNSSPQIVKDYTHAIITRNIFTVHPTKERFLTAREFMYLMGMPNDFEFVNMYKAYKILTQNVPVNTAMDMTKEVMKYLNDELPSSNAIFIKQDNTNQTLEIIEREDRSTKFFKE